MCRGATRARPLPTAQRASSSIRSLRRRWRTAPAAAPTRSEWFASYRLHIRAGPHRSVGGPGRKQHNSLISSRWSTVGARCPPELHTGRARRQPARLEYTQPMKRLIASVALIASLAVALRAADSDASRWWSSVEALASDNMEGRDTGSAAPRRAAEYVSSQFALAGLSPADGASGYVQPVKF